MEPLHSIEILINIVYMRDKFWIMKGSKYTAKHVRGLGAGPCASTRKTFQSMRQLVCSMVTPFAPPCGSALLLQRETKCSIFFPFQVVLFKHYWHVCLSKGLIYVFLYDLNNYYWHVCHINFSSSKITSSTNSFPTPPSRCLSCFMRQR